MDKERFEKGLAARKAVLGAEYVEKSLNAADDFNREFQEVLTEICWGACWGDETLDHKQRSLLNLGMIAALNRMVYIRGLPEDFDDWETAGNSGWGWQDVLPYFKKSETCSSGEDERRGGDGPLYVNDVSDQLHPLCQVFLQAGREAGYPILGDLNGTASEGVGLYQITTKDGIRMHDRTQIGIAFHWITKSDLLRALENQRHEPVGNTLLTEDAFHRGAALPRILGSARHRQISGLGKVIVR